MPNPISQQALLAARDEQIREELIISQEQTILRTASTVSNRYITKSDDEWSVALFAFSRAIDLYDEEKGEFLPFAQLIIRRDLIDEYRSHKEYGREVLTAPQILEGGAEPEEDTEGVYKAVVRASQKEDRSLKDEIIAANGLLQEYGFRFMDLTECSPQQERSRGECAAAIRWMLKEKEAVSELKKTKKLPVRALAKGAGVSRKTIDRYRKYLIMAVLILDGDYPQIAEYLKFVREERDR